MIALKFEKNKRVILDHKYLQVILAENCMKNKQQCNFIPKNSKVI